MGLTARPVMRQERPVPAEPSGLRAVPPGIWALGLVSMFMDVSSEMIHSLLPVFLVSVLGASTISVGFIEGVAEATASITRIFSGTLTDYLGRRKLLAGLGYGLAALTKPLFPLATSVSWVVTARCIDRIGKGIRGAPRDALIGDIAPPHLRGTCYGLRQSLDTVGACVGPLLAAALMAFSRDDFRFVFWVAVGPAFLSMALLVFGVTEPEREQPAGRARSPIQLRELARLGAAYWALVGVATVLALARFSEAFLVLRVQHLGLLVALVPLVLVVMNLAYALSAYPTGRLADRVSRRLLLAAGALVLIAGNLVLALAARVEHAMAGVILWGFHMGLTQGLLAAMVADATPGSLRGTAFGIFSLVTGVATLAASILAGWLWATWGAPAAFWAGASFAAIALAGLARPSEGTPRPTAP